MYTQLPTPGKKMLYCWGPSYKLSRHITHPEFSFWRGRKISGWGKPNNPGTDNQNSKFTFYIMHKFLKISPLNKKNQHFVQNTYFSSNWRKRADYRNQLA